MKIARLILEDGSQFVGWSFGYDAPTAGEVVFTTAMTGYPESLTDPSYAGQILVTTYPLIGNYGVPSLTPDPSPKGEGSNYLPPFTESEKIHVKGLIVADYSEQYSHWNAKESLASWLKREKIPAITGIDTRRLTKVLRESGVMMGRIEIDAAATPLPCRGGAGGGVSDSVAAVDLTLQTPPLTPPLEGRGTAAEDYGSVNWVEKVSCKEVITYQPEGEKKHRVVLVDCGVKANIIRCLIRRGIEVVRVPWDYDFNTLEFDGLFLANGPGDPERCEVTVEHIRTFLKNEEAKGTYAPPSQGRDGGESSPRPLMGICLGNQLLARAAGAKTYKLKYGHRSHNQPVQQVGTTRCFITSQNHGYAVDDKTLPAEWEALFVNMNDGSNEGIRHKRNPWMSAQFHPEACSGPVDTEFLFDEFVRMLNEAQK